MKRCTGIEFLNQCEYAVLCGDGYGCKYEGECDYQRPKITAHNSDYAKCAHYLIGMFDWLQGTVTEQDIVEVLKKHFA